jgi:hypothetical protein
MRRVKMRIGIHDAQAVRQLRTGALVGGNIVGHGGAFQF